MRPALEFGDRRLSAKFWVQVSPCPITGCWWWAGRYEGSRAKYGAKSARRAAYEALVGKLANHHRVRPSCGHAECCNPDHVQPLDPNSYYHRVVKPAKAQRAQQINNKKYHLYRYGLTLVEYDAKIAAQEQRCPVCCVALDLSNSRSSNAPHIDHCHKTGTLRDILCGRCNRGLGHFDDSPSRLRAAALYLEKHGKSEGE